jgi:hypothetical protein
LLPAGLTIHGLSVSANKSSAEAGVSAAKSGIAGDTPATTAQLLGTFLCGRGLVLWPHSGKHQGDDNSNRHFEEAMERNDPGGV